MLCGPALAFTATPSEVQRQQAISEGQALARKHNGYPVKDYLLYSVADAYTLTPDEGSVEAVQLATPLERTRWGSYFLTIQGKPLTAEAVRQQAGLAAGHLAVIVYAHSQDGGAKDQDFLKDLGPMHLILGGRTLTPTGITRSGASLNNYKDGGGQVVFRWTDALSATFDLSSLGETTTAQGLLRFTDATGKAFDLPVNLGKVQ